MATSLSNLTYADRSEALLLLAEALQEQSRWAESLAFLDQLGSLQQSRSTDLVFILRTRALRRLGYIDAEELRELPAKLVAFIKSPADRVSRIRAAVEVASVLDMLRFREPAPCILEILSSLPTGGLDLDDIANLLLAKSMLLYSVKDFASSLKCIHEATCILEQRNTSNSVLAMFHNGIGAILAKRGDYNSSIAAYRKCHQTAVRVGNDGIRLQASANLALSLMRLGEYEQAIEWAEEPLAFNASDLSPGFLFQAAQSEVLSCAMLRKADRAEELIQKRAEQFASFGSAGFSQAWSLYSADGYAILEKTHDAEEEGRRATEGLNDKIHMDFYAGPYARWVARHGAYSGNVRRSYEELDTLLLRLKTYDAIDQADILNAKCWLDSRTHQVSLAHIKDMQRHLEALPKAVGEQLARMGMLDFY